MVALFFYGAANKLYKFGVKFRYKNMEQKYYMTRVFDFLERLSHNNDREWFKAHKTEFDDLRALWLDDIQRLISLVAQWMPEVAMQTARQAAYRIYRDTRFSPDKTPYKTYFSAAISPRGREKDYAGFYIHQDIDNSESGLYGGIWCPPSPVLKKLRRAIVDNIEEWDGIMNSPGIKKHYQVLTINSLKTVPRDYPKDHPQAHWLRMRDYGLFAHTGREFFEDPAWPEKTAELLRPLAPFVEFLNYSIDE